MISEHAQEIDLGVSTEGHHVKEGRNRKLIYYRRHVEQVSFTNLDLVYAPSLMPGIFFYNFLASYAQHSNKKCPNNDHPLALLVPDTIIYNEKYEPTWVYTDKDGFVRKTREFVEYEVKDSLSSNLAETSPVVVSKEPCIGSMRNHPEHLIHHGNKVQFLGAKEFRLMLSQKSSSKSNFAFQKYIKSKGPRPFVVRVIYRESKPSFAWMINSSTDYNDESESILNRHSTHILKDHGCSFVKLTGRACADVVELNDGLNKYLEHSLRRAFDLLVTDYTKGEDGRWWFLQVKCFRVRGLKPGQALGLAPRVQRVYTQEYALVEDSDVQDTQLVDDMNNLNPFGVVAREFPCKSCQVLYQPSELSYKMTLKMIYETISRIRCRSNNAAIIALGSSRSILAMEKAHENNTSSNVESATMYHPWRVCALCYEIYEKEKLLIEIETRFSNYIGLPINGSHGIPYSPIKVDFRDSQKQNLPKQFTLCRFMLMFQAIYDIPKSFYREQCREREALMKQTIGPAPKSHKLFLRFEVLGCVTILPLSTNPIIETPSAEAIPGLPFSPNQRKRGNYCYWLPINLVRSFHFFSPKTSIEGKVREGSGLAKLLSQTPYLTLQLIRCKCKETKIIERLHVEHTLKHTASHRLQADSSTTPQHLDPRQYGFQYLGKTKLQLAQFRSSFVTKKDLYVALGATNYAFNLKGAIALERIKIVSSETIAALHQLTFLNGVYVPPKEYCTNDPMNPEWLDGLQKRSEIPQQQRVPRKNSEYEPIIPPTLYRSRSDVRQEIEKSMSFFSTNEFNGTSRYVDNNLEKLIDEASKKEEVEAEKQERKSTSKFSDARSDSMSSTSSLLDQLDLVFKKEKKLDKTQIPKQVLPIETEYLPIWCVTILLHRTHNLYVNQRGSGGIWEANYSIFGRNYIAIQKTIDKDSINDLEFNSSNKQYIACPPEALQDYFQQDRGVEIRLYEQSYRRDEKMGYTCKIEYGSLWAAHTLDGAFDIHEMGGLNIQLLAPNHYPPYISASIYIMNIGNMDSKSTSAYSIVHVTSEGINVLKKIV